MAPKEQLQLLLKGLCSTLVFIAASVGSESTVYDHLNGGQALDLNSGSDISRAMILNILPPEVIKGYK